MCSAGRWAVPSSLQSASVLHLSPKWVFEFPQRLTEDEQICDCCWFFTANCCIVPDRLHVIVNLTIFSNKLITGWFLLLFYLCLKMHQQDGNWMWVVINLVAIFKATFSKATRSHAHSIQATTIFSCVTGG